MLRSRKNCSHAELKSLALIAAVDHAKKFQRSESEAARLYGVSRQTLRRRLEDEHEGLKKRGPECFLGDEFEAELVAWIIALDKDRRPPCRAQVIAQCQSYIDWHCLVVPGAKNPSADWHPDSDWWSGFFARHPEVSEKIPQVFDDKRRLQECEPVVDHHFAELWKVLCMHDFLKKPWNIYATDESHNAMKVRSGKKLGQKGGHRADSRLKAADGTHVTFFPVCRAAQHPFPRRCAAEPGGGPILGGCGLTRPALLLAIKHSAVLPEKTCPLPEDHLSSGNGLTL